MRDILVTADNLIYMWKRIQLLAQMICKVVFRDNFLQFRDWIPFLCRFSNKIPNICIKSIFLLSNVYIYSAKTVSEIKFYKNYKISVELLCAVDSTRLALHSLHLYLLPSIDGIATIEAVRNHWWRRATDPQNLSDYKNGKNNLNAV